jgi:hypothetical protein
MQVLQTQAAITASLLIVSDGLPMENKKLHYGLVICMSGNIIIIESNSPAYGHPTSYYAIVTGSFARALIIEHIQLYMQQQLPPN